jgi:hypothetical protein
VALDQVAHCASLLVKICPAFDIELFVCDNRNVIYVTVVPDALEEWVTETEGKNVLYGFFGDIVVYTIDLVFAEVLIQYSNKFLR